MAAPNKKRAVRVPEEKSEDFDEKAVTSSSSDDEEDSQGNIASQEEIQVDFEGRNPIDSDFHGIKQLLHQLFLKAHVNLSELTDFIIGQNYVGSVIKQAFDGDEDDDDDAEEANDDNEAHDVFGITTVVNLTDKQNLECVGQLRTLLLELSQQHGGDQAAAFVKQLLSDDTKPVALLINERFVNIPSQITIPLLRSLSAELKKAVIKKMPFEFSYYVLICKLYKLEPKKTKKKKSKSVPEVIWSNQEEEFIDDEAELGFEFSVKNDTDSGLSGKWSDSDAEMAPFRKVLIFKAEKLDSIIDKLERVVTRQA